MAESMRRVGRKRSSAEAADVVPKALKYQESASFRHGAIRKIVLHNFLTFDDVVLEPSPQLNVIVGPNGTGKSSLVCAICLALCGSTGLLGRAKDLKDFVKNGPAKEGFVEITLHDSKGNHPVIRRNIFKDRNGSKWFVNGQENKDHQVKEVVKKYCVQLQNKCQFLPQDKVVEFAKLNCHALLEETEKAIGTEDMYELHQKLKGMKDKRVELENSLKLKTKARDELLRQNQLLERDVRRIRTRKKSIETIRYLKWKKCWIDYEEARCSYIQFKDKRKDVERKGKRLHQNSQPLKDKMVQNEAIVKRFEDTLKDHTKTMSSLEKKIQSEERRLIEVNESQKEACESYEHMKSEEESQEGKIRNLQNQIDSFRATLATLPTPSTIEPQLAEKNQAIQKISQDMSRLQGSQQEYHDRRATLEEQKRRFTDELSAINDVYKQRLDVLSRKDSDTFNALKWLQANKSRFRKAVYEPILTLLHIKDMRYARQIENFFSGRDLFAFIFECREDRETFAREVRDRMNLRVNMVIAPSVPLDHFKCDVPMETLRSFGFEYMMMDLVEAPPPVLTYFCRYHKLFNVPLTASTLSSQILSRFVASYPSISRFYTSDQMYIIRRSRYRNQSITKSERILQCQFFLSSVDEELKQSLTDSIESANEEMKLIDTELAELNEKELTFRKQDTKIRKEKQDLREGLNSYRRSRRMIEQREIQMKQLQETPIDLEEEYNKLKRVVLSCAEKRQDTLRKISVHVQVYKGHLLSKIHTQFNLMVAIKRKQDFEEEFRELTNELKESDASINQAKEAEQTSKRKAHDLMEEAKKVTGVHSPDQLSAEITAMFQTFPEDSSSLDDLIHEHQAQVEMHSSSLSNSENTIRQFEGNEVKISELDQDIEQHDSELRDHEGKTNDLKTRWLTPLTEMISQINTRFSKFFRDMKCAGEVSLLSHENDYSKYGVEIRVKFRSEEELHVLDAQHQSGGERSVSTMLYLMALQDITNCPFRVVDEINQGMDSNNERNVFDQIVTTIGQRDTSQYFLLTPKLLQDLRYSPAVTVHIIHNGPKMVKGWDKELYI